MGIRNASGVLGRRGLLAGAAALVAGGLAKLARPDRTQAGHNYGQPGTSPNVDSVALHLGADNDVGLGPTSVSVYVSSSAAFTVGNGIGGVADRGHGISGWSGYGGGAAGVQGRSYSFSTGGGFGVLGQSPENGMGVCGTTESSSPTGVPVPGAGVYGKSGKSTGVGVFGTGMGSGVRGESGNGNGVFGVSSNATGVYGFSGNSFGAAGVSNTGVGVYASSGSNWGLHVTSPIFAGVFSGAVYVNGNFTVANGAKSAAVKNKRGEHRRVYCQESPEPWFEDFGRGELKGGRAEVALDPEFDAVVKGDDYMVFPVPEGDCRGLYVSRQGPHRFEVRELQGGTSSLPFSYRVVARRLDDVGRRLEKLDVPDFSKVTRPVTPPDLPAMPDRPGR